MWDNIDLLTLQQYIAEREYTLHFGEELFPNRKDDIINLEYIVGANNAPVSASIRAIDAESQIAGRYSKAEKFSEEILVISKKIPLNERFILFNLQRGQGAEEALYKEIFNDADKMVEAVRMRIERMRFEALFDGKLNINENGFVGEVDYGVPEDNQIELEAAEQWNTDTANWLQNIEDWLAILAKNGVQGTRILTTSAVAASITKNAATKEMIYGNKEDGRYLSLNILNDFMKWNNLPTIVTYDGVYNIEKNDGTIESKPYIPHGKLVLMGDENPGFTQFGTTAEELALRRSSEADVEDFGNIIVVTNEDTDPPTIWTKAAARALPSLPNAHRIIQAQVLEPSV